MVRVLVMSGYGINCESETAHAFERAGASCDIVHINDLIARVKHMADYDIMVFPGGFSYGDNTGSGNAYANRLRHNLWDDLLAFIADGKLILGLCNGFQIMTRLGLFALPDGDYGTVVHALEANTTNRYECRWVTLAHQESVCVFTRGMTTTHIPIAHGEGRFWCDAKMYDALVRNGQIVFRYATPAGASANGVYPANPNGALHDIAAICDRTGRIMGMMPHPERGLYSVSEPEFARKHEQAKRTGTEVPELIASNFMIFTNAVAHCTQRGKK